MRKKLEHTMTESLHKFPCEFIIKVFGNKNDEFETTVITIIRQHCPDLRENALVLRPSKDGKYLAISVTLEAESKEQIDAIYRDLSANPNILMAL
jgi:putative lipoic acid-binding regulatory protein